MWKEVAEGGAFDLINLDQYESQLEEGSKNWLQLSLRMPVSAGVAADLENILNKANCLIRPLVDHRDEISPHLSR